MPDSMTSLHDSSSTSRSLIERARSLDAEAWRRLCEVYGPVVYRWAKGKGLQATDAADIGQEVFRAVAMKIGTFRRDRPGDTFRGWLWTITHHKLGDYFRTHNNQPRAVGGSTARLELHERAEDGSLDSSVGDDADAEREILHRALALIRVEFELTTWQAFWRTTVDGLSIDQVAAEVNLSAGAVRQAKYRVLRRLRDEMRDENAT
ncbi:MAG: sigma-70 family RNA polymerase sigma factor [Planctomycetia bacterium]|nr:sigma-70 family RNA polymerase sigma factor [Planctomycetia bacterium]